MVSCFFDAAVIVIAVFEMDKHMILLAPVIIRGSNHVKNLRHHIHELNLSST